MNSFYSGCVLVALSSYICVLAYSEICYNCSGIGCNDPFNVTNAVVMNCSSSNTYRAGAGARSIDMQLEEKIFPSIYGPRATTSEYVCTKFVYEIDSSHQVATVRRCVAKTIDNASACDAIKKTVSATIGNVQSCSTCDTDLCNSGVSLTQSFVISFLLVCFTKILV